MTTISTFIDLYKYLQTCQDFPKWLNDPWKGKDKQESVLRLFAVLNLITKIHPYKVCHGNFNLQSIKKIICYRELFYDNKNNPIYLKNNGDSSDLTCIDGEKILAITSKNISKLNINKLDIDKLLTNTKDYKNCVIGVAVRCQTELNKAILNSKPTSQKIRDVLLDKSTIIIDHKDLYEAFTRFKSLYGNVDIENLSKVEPTLLFRLHQTLGIIKTIRLKSAGCKKILWGQIPRSGKSYIMAGTIQIDMKNKPMSNYMIMTTAPNETIEQYINIMNCIKGVSCIYLNSSEVPKLSNFNIIICSKQFLQNKKLKWLHDIKFDILFIDESHNGGTTVLTKNTLDYYANNVFTVQITATYSKPANDYDIPKSNWVLWDLEDVQLCKQIDTKRDILIAKHPDLVNIIDKYSIENIKKSYKDYPSLVILTDKIDQVDKIIENTSTNSYGWSPDACFLLKQNTDIVIPEFQNEAETLKIWYRIFGKRDEFGIPYPEYPDDKVFMKRIEKICKNPEYNSRFFETPSVVMAFLPQRNINMISVATKLLLEKYKVIPDFEIVCINSNVSNNPKKIIEDARLKTLQTGKKGVLVLSGRQCSLGVTINDCDIVLLLNKSNSFDMIYQMMFRCMTEGPKKTAGFVVDLNIKRAIETNIIDYSLLIKPDQHPKDVCKYLLQERIVNLNCDHWIPSFGFIDGVNRMTDTIYNQFTQHTESALEHFMDRLKFKEILLSKDEGIMFNAIFSNTNMDSNLITKLINDVKNINDANKIKDGIEKTKPETGLHLEATTSTTPTKPFNYMEVLRHMIPLMCILTIHDTKSSFEEMYDIVRSSDILHKILITQTQGWWGKNVNENAFKAFIDVYIKYMKNSKETNLIIRTIKELFNKNVSNSENLSKLIDKYLQPQDLEKKTNAEVSTPYILRQEMLDKVPDVYWKSPNKTFEPCSGKGGFLVDIVDRFMKNLPINDPDERYRVIVEECLYWSDINSTNIFIGKLLLDPFNKYKLKYNQGDTLQLDIKTKWNLDGFDMVVGNPPYNSSGSIATGNTIWQHFVKKALDVWIKPNMYLLYVHPPGWRKPHTPKGKSVTLFNSMTKSCQMIYLSIHNVKDGIKIFGCGTRYDWYILQKIQNYTYTTISDEYHIIHNINLNNMNWLPSSNIIEHTKLLAVDNMIKCPVIYSCNLYETRKKYMSKTKSDVYKFTCIHSTPMAGTRYMYSSRNDNGHFGISKVIFGEAGINHVIIDMKGEYAMTQGAIAIQIDSLSEAEHISRAIQSEKFQNILQSCMWSNFRIDWRLFTYFKKDFWKEFI